MERKKELKQKESLLLAGLDKKGSKLQNVALWSLGTGLVGLIGWGIYKSLSPTKIKKKKKDKKPPKDYPALDSFIEQTAPKIGKWILKEFKK